MYKKLKFDGVVQTNTITRIKDKNGNTIEPQFASHLTKQTPTTKST